jgi:chromate reductase
VRVLGIAGSLRAGSHNRRLLELAAESFPDGVELAVWEELRAVPPYDADTDEGSSRLIASFRSAVAESDAVLIVTPEYNGSIPGALKNALDWASRPRDSAVFRDKPVAVIGASTNAFGAVRGHAETRRILGIMRSRVVDAELSLPNAHERLAAPDRELREQLRAVIHRLVEEASARANAVRAGIRGRVPPGPAISSVAAVADASKRDGGAANTSRVERSESRRFE